MSNNAGEREPLLGARPDGAAEPESSGLPPAVLHRSFVLATMASLIAGTLTIFLLVVSAIVMGKRPKDYRPPWEVYYHFAPTAGWVRASPRSQVVPDRGHPCELPSSRTNQLH